MDQLFILALLIMPYLVLGAVIVVKARGVRNVKDYSIRPTVTVYLPTYNEEKHIARKLDNLLSQSYHIDEILIIDCSTDATPQIIELYKKKYPQIMLMSQSQRMGMARTLNQALKIAKCEIFVKTDCDSISELSALKELIANFAEKNIGGATGICVADGGVEKYFRKIMTAIQVAESNIDSTLITHSTSLLAFRTAVTGPVKENSVADDTEEFLLIRRKGYKTIIDPAVISREEVPSNSNIRRMQKNRRSQGIVKVLLQNIDMLLNPNYRKYGMFVLPIEWFILILSPVLLIALAAVFTYTLYLIHPYLAITVIVVIVVAIVQKSNVLYAIIDTELSGLVGFMRSILKGNGDGLWQKVR